MSTDREAPQPRVDPADVKRLRAAVKWHGETGDEFLTSVEWEALRRILAAYPSEDTDGTS